MKVKLEDNYKKWYTIEDLERAKMVIACEKDDEETAKGWLEYAVREAMKHSSGYLERGLEAEAHTARNCRAWDAYDNGSGNMDVWIKGVAKTSCGYIEVGAYLSDIWQTGAVEYKHHMYIVEYKKAE